MPTDNTGIILGNPNGDIHIVKVCNPYCIHCAKAQIVLDEITKSNNRIKLQIIFTGSSEESHYNELLNTFLTLYYEGSEMQDVLFEWFSSKDISKCSSKKRFQIDKTMTLNIEDNIRNMSRFCQDQKIQWTPTVFINGHLLPKIYDVEDLKYFY